MNAFRLLLSAMIVSALLYTFKSWLELAPRVLGGYRSAHLAGPVQSRLFTPDRFMARVASSVLSEWDSIGASWNCRRHNIPSTVPAVRHHFGKR